VIAGGRRLRAQDVHGLSQCRPRDHVRGKGADAPRGQGTHQLDVGQRIEQADERRALANLGNVGGLGRVDLHEQVGLGEQRFRAGLDGGADRAIVGIADESTLPRARFDAHFDLLRDESLDRLGNDGNPCFCGHLFFGNRESHAPSGVNA
jgi:hypothetical protein